MIKNSLNLYFSPLNSQRGQSSVYVIIFIIVIIFAVMFSGGGGSLFSGNTPSSVTDAPSPTTNTNATPPSSKVSWDIQATMTSCDRSNPNDPASIGTLDAKGTEKGYILIKTIDSAGKATLQIVAGFEPLETKLGLALLKSKGFSSNQWSIELYSGGGTVNNAIGGGTLQKSLTKDPTGCQ